MTYSKTSFIEVSKTYVKEMSEKAIQGVEAARIRYKNQQLEFIMDTNKNRKTWFFFGKPDPMGLEEAEALYEKSLKSSYGFTPSHKRVYGKVLRTFETLKYAATDNNVYNTMTLSLSDYEDLTYWAK